MAALIVIASLLVAGSTALSARVDPVAFCQGMLLGGRSLSSGRVERPLKLS